ncbi:hypothetical protein BDV12DRAFT_189506 [Aspergillus spectabilis]
MDPSRVVYKNPATATILQSAEARRSIYGLKSESPVSDDVIESIIQVAVSHVPSSFNTQTSRVVLLLKEEHQKLWNITLKIMEGLVASGTLPKEAYESSTKPKLEGFRAGYGTVLFFVDYDSLTSIKEKFAIYADKFDSFALESNAMSQWTTLTTEGFGANLQHYSPLIGEEIQKQWNVPTKLDAQLVFGTPISKPLNKQFAPLEDRFKIFGKST